MVTAVQRFAARDGQVFDTAEAANAYEQRLDAIASIEAYVARAELRKASAGLVRKHLAAYVEFSALPRDVPDAGPTLQA